MQGFRFLSLLPTHNQNTDIAIRKSEFGNSRRSPDRLKRRLKKIKRRKNLLERRFIFTKRRSGFVLYKVLIADNGEGMPKRYRHAFFLLF